MPDEITEATRGGLNKAIRIVATKGHEGIRNAAPRVVKPAISLQFQTKGGILSGEVRAGGLSGVIVEGAGPHRIEPREAKALAWAGGARPFGAVEHPGSMPNDFFNRGLDNIPEEATKALFEAGGMIAFITGQIIGRRVTRRGGTSG